MLATNETVQDGMKNTPIVSRAATKVRTKAVATGSDISSRGEPFLWALGGALSLGILMVAGFLVLILWNGIVTFYPKEVRVVRLSDGKIVAGEPWRSEKYKLEPGALLKLGGDARKEVAANEGYSHRTLYHIGNYDLYNEDFRWVSDFNVLDRSTPRKMFYIEREEWGPFIGSIDGVTLNGKTIPLSAMDLEELHELHAQAADRRNRLKEIEKDRIGGVNYSLNEERLKLKRAAIKYGEGSAQYRKARTKYEKKSAELQAAYTILSAQAESVKKNDAKYTITLSDVNGKEKTIRLSELVRFYPANDLSLWGKMGVYFSRWAEFLTEEPREANTEGGVWPAIFGTFCMTVLMALAVAPFGVMAALYLREYAKQGKLVSAIRICVNNLAGVPSIVYGVFGLGFFSYVLGGAIDKLFFAERLPNPTFGTGGLLWASLTLALLTVPVVIVSTEEALAAVPNSMREGSLACGASKWQTIRNIILPRAMPGIMTGLILAMARGAGEVAPLMIVGVVKLAPALPIDGFFPYFHLERSFMHLGFHIYDVGFQSRNSEAGKPMVFVTTLLLIGIVFLMNALAIVIRNRLKRKFYVGHF